MNERIGWTASLSNERPAVCESDHAYPFSVEAKDRSDTGPNPAPEALSESDEAWLEQAEAEAEIAAEWERDED
jgi:hypothetical protein